MMNYNNICVGCKTCSFQTCVNFNKQNLTLDDILIENDKLKEDKEVLKYEIEKLKKENNDLRKMCNECFVERYNESENTKITKKINIIKEWVKKSPYNFSCHYRLLSDYPQLAKWICDFPLFGVSAWLEENRDDLCYTLQKKT